LVGGGDRRGEAWWGRPVALLARELAPGRRLLALSSDETTPAAIAGLLVGAGYGASVLHVLGDLGSDRASRIDATAQEWDGPAPRLNVVGIELRGPHRYGWTAGLPDNAYANDGQLTKRDLRASALARLAPTPGALLWDIGAGAGSLSIEWSRAHPTCRALAIEANDARAARIAENAAALGVPTVRVVHGAAPDALAGLPDPDAIFIGGGATVPGVLERCLDALRPGGRLVVHGVTLETEVLLGVPLRRTRRRTHPDQRRDRRPDRHLHRLEARPPRHAVGVDTPPLGRVDQEVRVVGIRIHTVSG
jgi:precorrin-6Y C5,15-methyltransferase (decarboxylating)